MFKRSVSSAVCLFVAVNAHGAIEEKEYAKCAAIDGDLARLECFDGLARVKKLDGRQAQPVSTDGVGQWVVSADINPVDDSKTVTLLLRSDSGKNRWGKSPLLIVRCMSNSTSMIINWSAYLGREAEVLTRVGANKAATTRWALSTDSQATFHPQPIAFLKQLLAETKMVAQITPYNESPVTAVFDTRGLENAIKPLRETCGW